MNINLQDVNGATPLHLVLVEHNVRLNAGRRYPDGAFKQFLRFDDIDPNVKDKQGNTTLHLACMRDDNVLFVSRLITRFKTIGAANTRLNLDLNLKNDLGYTALGIAYEARLYKVVEYLIQHTDIVISEDELTIMEKDQELTNILHTYKEKHEIKLSGGKKKQTKIRKNNKKRRKTFRKSKKILSLKL